MENKELTELVATSLLRAGKEQGISYFFNAYDTALIYFALRIVNDEASAEDIVAEAFIKLWNNREQLLQPSSVKPYLYRTVRNASLDFLRAQKKVRTHQKEVVYLNEVSEEMLLSFEIETQTHHNLYKALQGLPPRCGQVFRMFYLQRKSLPQIARELQLSVNTVRNQKTQALLYLRKSLTYCIWCAVWSKWF